MLLIYLKYDCATLFQQVVNTVLALQITLAALGGLVVIELATVPKVGGFKPGRGWIFKGDKNP
jgi:hypothetical protein